MTDWLIVTGIDGSKGLIPLDKIAYIDEGYEHGGACIFLPTSRDGKLLVQETIDEIVANLTNFYN